MAGGSVATMLAMEKLHRAQGIAGNQHGIVSRRQLHSCLLSDNEIRTLVRKGWLTKVHPSVFSLGGPPRTDAARIWASWLWAGPNSAVSHRAAAFVQGIDGLRHKKVEVSTRSDLKAVKGVVVHRPRRLPDWQLDEVGGLQVTNVERTLLDLCAVCYRYECQNAMDHALMKKQTTYEALKHIEAVESKSGRTGMRLFHQLLAERDPVLSGPGSPLARRFLEWLRSCGFPEPVAEHRLRGPHGFVKVLDFAYVDGRLGFEVDGRAAHTENFDSDRKADTILGGMGWRVIRVTSAHIGQTWLRDSVAAALKMRLV